MTEIKYLVFVLELHLQQIFDVDLRDVVHDESETVLRKQLQKNKTIRDCFWLSLDVIRRVSGTFHSASRATRHALMFGQICLHQLYIIILFSTIFYPKLTTYVSNIVVLFERIETKIFFK